MKTMAVWTGLMAVILGFALVGCGGIIIETPLPSDQISKMTADKSCTATSQCKSAIYGFNGCAPTKTVIYSTKNTSAAELQVVLDLYTQMERKQVEQSQQAGICVMPLEPTLACTNNICQAQ